MSDAAITSPCTKICTIDPDSGWCEGCLRSLDEIAAWGALDPAERQAIIARLPARREQARQRAGLGSEDPRRPGLSAP